MIIEYQLKLFLSVDELKIWNYGNWVLYGMSWVVMLYKAYKFKRLAHPQFMKEDSGPNSNGNYLSKYDQNYFLFYYFSFLEVT